MNTRTKKAATAIVKANPWPRMSVSDLAGHPGNLRPADGLVPELAADIAAHGVVEPLYVVTTHGDVPQVIDGFQRLAAAIAAGHDTLPYTDRPVIAVARLTPHPANAREDLGITPEFVASLASEGCRVPVKIQRLDGGVMQINDGNRRYFGAIEAGLTHLPYEYDERDTASQMLDMVTTSAHGKRLTVNEEAAALFAAHEAGAGLTRMAKASGRKTKDVKAAITVSASTALRSAVQDSGAYPWTLEEFAALSEFADDPDALSRITQAAAVEDIEDADADEVQWVIQRERTRQERAAKAAAHRAELEAAGYKVRDHEELSDRAMPVRKLYQKGKPVSPEAHAGCPGSVWVLDSNRQDGYEPWCTSPALNGHDAERTSSSQKSTDQTKQERAAVKAGNLDWDAATALRRKWIAEQVKRRTLAKETTAVLTAMITRALVNGDATLSDQLTKHRTTEALAQLLGLSDSQAKSGRRQFAQYASQDPRRALQSMFAVYAAAQESQAYREAWRTDAMKNSEIRGRMCFWFATLTVLGYKPTRIEKSVIDDQPYNPDAAKNDQAATDGATID